jgi:putative PIN family toxin of toxin-antitoxin system
LLISQVSPISGRIRHRPHPAVCRDPGDDYLVALAHAANAEVLVTGDVDLLSLEEPDVPVLTPRELVERLEL